MNSVFNEITKNYSTKIYELCNSFIHNKSMTDDLYQEVMINIWKHQHKFKQQSNIFTWIYKIVLNTSINFNLKEKRRKSFLEKFFQLSLKVKFEIPKIQEEMNDNKIKLRNEIEQLQTIEKSIFKMYLDEMSYKEIAEVLGVSTNKIGVKINRIKSKLTKNIKS